MSTVHYDARANRRNNRDALATYADMLAENEAAYQRQARIIGWLFLGLVAFCAAILWWVL